MNTRPDIHDMIRELTLDHKQATIYDHETHGT